MFRPRQPEQAVSSKRKAAAVHSDEPADRPTDRIRTAKGPRISTATRKFQPYRSPKYVVSEESAAASEAAVPRALLPGLSRLDELGLDDFLTWTFRFKWLIAASVALCMAAALTYALTASPRFTVYTDIMIDPADLNVVSDDVFASSPQRDSQLLEVESKLRVLTSRNVLSRVIERLDLTRDKEFVKPDMMAGLKALIGIEEPAGNGEVAAMRALSERVQAQREERSFVVVLSVWSEDPQKAIIISQAISDAFEEELFRSSAASAARVAESLKRRLDELRQNVTDAERRVEEFRRNNGLQAAATGELMSNQQSSELNTQVLEAQQRLIQAQSRYAQMKSAMDRGSANSAAIFDSETMTRLREQYNNLQQEIGSLVQTYGPKHARLLAARSSQATVQAAIDQEARRVLELARAGLAREQEGLDALRGKATDKQTNVFTENAAQVQLRDLQRDARTKAAIYESYLARAQQVAEREQLDTTNVRVISPPLPPKSRSWPPRTLVLLGGGAAAGLMIGLGLALALGLWKYLRMPPVERPRRVAA